MSDTKQFVFGSTEDQSVVSLHVEGEHHDPDEGFPRPVYGYTITTENWTYEAADIHGDQGETPDLDKAAQSLFAYLHNCVVQEDNEFPVNVRAWASRYVDEIADLATPSMDSVDMTMRDGSLVDADEDCTQF